MIDDYFIFNRNYEIIIQILQFDTKNFPADYTNNMYYISLLKLFINKFLNKSFEFSYLLEILNIIFIYLISFIIKHLITTNLVLQMIQQD